MKNLVTAIALFACTLVGCAGNAAPQTSELTYERIEAHGRVLEIFAEYSEDLDVIDYELTYFDGFEETFVEAQIAPYDAEVGPVVPNAEVRDFFSGVPAELRERLHAAAERLEQPPVAPESIEPLEVAPWDFDFSALALVTLDDIVDVGVDLPTLDLVDLPDCHQMGCAD